MIPYQYIPIIIAIVGSGAAAAFLSVGIKSALDDETIQFEKEASSWVKGITTTYNDFELTALWINEACRSTSDIHYHDELFNQTNTRFSICSRENFQELYEYVTDGAKINLQMMAFLPNVTHQYRKELEDNSKSYYETNYPNSTFKYKGFMGIEKNSLFANGTTTDPSPRVLFKERSEQPFYFPHHLIQPINGNEELIDFDAYSIPQKHTIDMAVTTWSPLISNPIEIPGPNLNTINAFGALQVMERQFGYNQIFLLHPGMPLSTHPNQTISSGLASSTIQFRDFIQRAASTLTDTYHNCNVYVMDISVAKTQYQFFGGVKIENNPNEKNFTFTYLDDIDLETLRRNKAAYYSEQELEIAQQTWVVVVTADKDKYKPQLTFVILGGVLILFACFCLALWLHARIKREKKVTELKNMAEQEKAALIIDNAEKAAQSERDLNAYLSHEIRNPLTSAMTACSFLSSSYHDHKGAIGAVNDDESYHVMKEDINVVHSSLEFINDLLRSMLDARKVVDNQLKLEMSHTSLLKDVFEPVRTILTQRGNNFDVEIDCPDDLVIMADRMRLKQIVLNLASNSRKFVTQGYIRLRGEVVNEDDGENDHFCIKDKSSSSTSSISSTDTSKKKRIEISVEDSGPGIPKEKRSMLFNRFQESLDSLNQGTGVGLFLCVTLVKLMDGKISLDEDYDSGIDGYPGSRFVVSLNTEPIDLDETQHELLDELERGVRTLEKGKNTSNFNPNMDSHGSDHHHRQKVMNMEKSRRLPDKLSVLVVDDDMVLRKLLSRSLKRVAPEWNVKEAANGETALTMVDNDNFDLIFMDQYMASVEKQMLGTEAVFALRAKGVKCRICGLSANDMEDAFLDAGANVFMLKPFSNVKEDLTKDLLRILYYDKNDEVIIDKSRSNNSHNENQTSSGGKCNSTDKSSSSDNITYNSYKSNSNSNKNKNNKNNNNMGKTCNGKTSSTQEHAEEQESQIFASENQRIFPIKKEQLPCICTS